MAAEQRVTLAAIRDRMRRLATPEQAAVARRFFKSGPGEYGEGDAFIGLKVPQIRGLIRSCDPLPASAVLSLIRSKFHEERLLGLYCLIRRFARGDEKTKKHVFGLYLKHTKWINNWDLVDTSAPHIVGAWLIDRDRAMLRKLARSGNLWERRMAVLATQAFIRRGEVDDTLQIIRALLGDNHDLIHKACGWMLREIGKRDVRTLESFLAMEANRMPRTMLRYAIEKLPEKRRKAWLAGQTRLPANRR